MPIVLVNVWTVYQAAIRPRGWIGRSGVTSDWGFARLAGTRICVGLSGGWVRDGAQRRDHHVVRRRVERGRGIECGSSFSSGSASDSQPDQEARRPGRRQAAGPTQERSTAGRRTLVMTLDSTRAKTAEPTPELTSTPARARTQASSSAGARASTRRPTRCTATAALPPATPMRHARAGRVRVPPPSAFAVRPASTP